MDSYNNKDNSRGYSYALDYCPKCGDRVEITCRTCHPLKVENIDWAIAKVDKMILAGLIDGNGILLENDNVEMTMDEDRLCILDRSTGMATVISEVDKVRKFLSGTNLLPCEHGSDQQS